MCVIPAIDPFIQRFRPFIEIAAAAGPTNIGDITAAPSFNRKDMINIELHAALAVSAFMALSNS